MTGYATACARGCVLRNRHTPDCGTRDGCDCCCHTGGAFRPPCDQAGGCGPHTPDTDCRGCLPRPPVPGGLVCVTCWERTTEGLLDLPDLHEDLLTPTSAPSSGVRVSGSGEASLPLADDPRWVRTWAKAILLHWGLVLSRPPAPTWTQTDAWHEADGRGEHPAPLPAPPYGRALAPLASDEPRVTAARLTIHADWLLSQTEHADQFAHDILTVTAIARHTAAPAIPIGISLGPCPILTPRLTVDDDPDDAPCSAPLRAYPDQPLIQCPACGTVADVWWWRNRILEDPTLDDDPDGNEPLAHGGHLSTWLSGQYAPRMITEVVIRQWASASGGVVIPDEQGVRRRIWLERRGKQANRTLYPTRQALAIARHLYGEPFLLDTA
jgi:hypothetical protein